MKGQYILGKKSILFTWLLSYVLLIVVQLGISTMSYMQVYQEVETEVEQYAQSKLSGVGKSVRARMEMLDKMLVGISLDPQVLNFLSVSGEIEGEKSYQMLQTVQNLKLYTNGINFTDQVFVYFKQSEMVVTPQEALPAERFYERYLQGENLTLEEWKNNLFLESAEAYQIVRKTREGQPAIIEIHQQLPLSDRYHKTAVIGVRLQEEQLLDVDDSQLTEQETVYVLDDTGQIVCQYGQSNAAQQIAYSEMLAPNGTLYRDVEGEKFAVAYADVGVKNWKVVSSVHADVFWRKLERLRNITVLSMAAVVLLQLVIAYYFMKKNYDPIKELIRAISENSGKEYSGKNNEYYYIQDALKGLLKEKKDIANTLKQQKNSMKEEALVKLLKGLYDSTDTARKEMERVGIALGSGLFVVLAFNNEDISELFAEDPEITEQERYRLSQYILGNVAEDLASQFGTGNVAELEDIVLCVLEVRPQERDWKEAARQLAAMVCEAIDQNFHMHTAAAFGCGYQGISGIHTSYIEAMEALEYKQVMGAAGYPCYEDISDAPESRLYQYSLKDEQNLIEAIQDGDYSRAKFVLDKVFRSNFEDNQYKVSVVRCFMMDIAGTIMRAVGELAAGRERDQDFSDMKPVHALLECTSVKQLRKEADELLQQICAQVKEENEKNTKSVQQEMMDYIQEHYMDVNLNVSYLGEQFSLAPSYLSKLFKEQSGQSLLDYINMVRIEKAKELLCANPDDNMDQIAAAVGYSGRITFSRLFKKYVGCTPGIYKETHHKK